MGLARRLIRQPGSSSSPPHPGAQGPPHPGAPSSPPREHLLPTREYPPPWRGAPSPRSGSCSSRGGEVALPGGELRLPGGEASLPGGEAGLQGGEAALPGGEAALPGWEAALPGWGERLSRVGSSVLPGGERCSPHPGSTLLRVGRGPKTREFRLPGRANRGELLPGFWPPPGVGRALSRGWGEGRIFEVSSRRRSTRRARALGRPCIIRRQSRGRPLPRWMKSSRSSRPARRHSVVQRCRTVVQIAE